MGIYLLYKYWELVLIVVGQTVELLARFRRPQVEVLLASQLGVELQLF